MILKDHQSGFDPDDTRLGCEYVNLKKRKFCSHFLETRQTMEMRI